MILMILSVILILLILSGAYFAYRTAFYSPINSRPTIDAPLHGEQYKSVEDDIRRISCIMEKAPFEEIIISSDDGTLLYGRYYHLLDGAPLEILVHGYRAHAFRDCSGSHALSRKLCFNTLVVDQRAHGKSGSTAITFGIRERYDILKWIQYANGRFGSSNLIILSGISMGAATVLMAAGLKLPANVTCIIADSPYSSPEGIIRKVCADIGLPVFFSMPFVRLGARLFGGFSLRESSAKEAVRHATVPILLIHGEDDRLVPCSMSTEIAAHCASPVTVHTFPGAGHGLCYISDPISYEGTIYHFLSQIPPLKGRISETFSKQYFQN